jgi:hypothetical protein
MGSLSTQLRRLLRHIPLLAAAILIFLGLVFLGGLAGLVWHSRTFAWWVALNPSVVGPTEDWLVWAACLIISMFPIVAAVVRGKPKLHPVVISIFLVLPLFSLLILSWSHVAGTSLLVGLGFLIASVLVSRSETLLGIENRSAARVICAGVFGFMSVAAAGGIVSVLLWQKEAFIELASRSNLAFSDIWLRMMTIDMEVFYLARPLLSATFIALAIAATVALFREPLQTFVRSISRRLKRGKRPALDTTSASSPWRSRRWAILVRGLPYVTLTASVVLGFALTLYPYMNPKNSGVAGSDSWFYVLHVGYMNTLGDALQFLGGDRGLFLLLLFLLRAGTGLSPEWIVRLMPALLSGLLAVSTFVLVKEGTGRLWVSALGALLSVVSAQTSLGMGAGILANWFALSLANFTFALIVRSIRLHSKLAAVGSIVFSLFLLSSYAFLWVVVIAVLGLVLFARIFAFRKGDSGEWKYEVGLVSGVLLGAILVPTALSFVLPVSVASPSDWLARGWNYLAQQATLQAIASSPAVLEATFDFAGNRVDLPFLTLLSIVGLLDQVTVSSSFRRIISAMVLLPFAAAIITPDIYFTWRGLYLIPLYLTGALGTESIIRRANDRESTWASPDRLAFAGTFAAYVFLSHLSYSLRALELLIMVAF